MISDVIAIWMKFFFLLTPFFVLSMFLSMTQGWETRKRAQMAMKIGVAALVACLTLFFFGNALFRLLGITIDAFRIGAGSLLFLTAVSLMTGAASESKVEEATPDIAVVPLAIPITVGPGTTGALLVMGAESTDFAGRLGGCVALGLAVGSLLLLLLLASHMERIFKRQGICILSKITGLFISAMAAQMIFTGIRGFLCTGTP